MSEKTKRVSDIGLDDLAGDAFGLMPPLQLTAYVLLAFVLRADDTVRRVDGFGAASVSADPDTLCDDRWLEPCGHDLRGRRSCCEARIHSERHRFWVNSSLGALGFFIVFTNITCSVISQVVAVRLVGRMSFAAA